MRTINRWVTDSTQSEWEKNTKLYFWKENGLEPIFNLVKRLDSICILIIGQH